MKPCEVSFSFDPLVGSPYYIHPYPSPISFKIKLWIFTQDEYLVWMMNILNYIQIIKSYQNTTPLLSLEWFSSVTAFWFGFLMSVLAFGKTIRYKSWVQSHIEKSLISRFVLKKGLKWILNFRKYFKDIAQWWFLFRL